MSLEAKIEALTAAVTGLTKVMQGGQVVVGSVEQTAPAKSEPNKAQADEPELVWYHKPETKEVWQEPEQGRRKGITKIDESTAERLIAQYEEEADQASQDEQAAAAGQPDDDLDMDFGEGSAEDGAKYDESEPMDRDTFATAWREFTTRAVQHAKDEGADDADAQTEVKKFIVPLVKQFCGKAEPKVANIPEDDRARFLNQAEGFFAA